MIVLPAKKKLIRKRAELYAHLSSIIHIAPAQHVENIMRQIHCINFRLRTYFQRERDPLAMSDEEYNDKFQIPRHYAET